MAYGFLVRNENEEIQIDGDYQNLYFHESGTVTLDNPETLVWKAFASATDAPCSVAIKPPSKGALPLGLYYDSGSDTYLGFSIVGDFESQAVWDIEYAAFTYKLATGAPTSGYNLVVYNADGYAVFWGGMPTMKVVATYSVGNPMSGGVTRTGTTVDVQDANNHYFIIPEISYAYATIKQVDPNTYQVGLFSVGLKASSSTQVVVQPFVWHVAYSGGFIDKTTVYTPNINLIEVAIP